MVKKMLKRISGAVALVYDDMITYTKIKYVTVKDLV